VGGEGCYHAKIGGYYDARTGILDSNAAMAGIWAVEQLAEPLYRRRKSLTVHSSTPDWVEAVWSAAPRVMPMLEKDVEFAFGVIAGIGIGILVGVVIGYIVWA